ncbi:helix-turn-helix transcriptional regulator [Psychromonas sp. MME2]|uniref:helix-turn-helix domain-containing protein n=1 Tax=unclassified Psychromonas TaxID=2614957 RepID=UPI00339C44FD
MFCTCNSDKRASRCAISLSICCTRGWSCTPGTIRRIFNETETRVELNVVETLCEYLKIEVGDLYELPKKDLEGESEETV